jgi:ABC-type sugar transport system ATPase subunit
VNIHAGLRPTTPAEVTHQIELCDISKTFAAVKALDAVSLTGRPGELLAVTRPSGAGKSTLCRIIAGLETADAGICRIAGKDVSSASAASRRIAYMFESYALYPHLTVRENVMSPLIAPNGRGSDLGIVDACWSSWRYAISPRDCRPSCRAARSSGSRLIARSYRGPP